MPTALPSPPLLWDLFCQVIDNHGDLGVCWRLATQLAARGQEVRLWVDDARALAWMAPGAVEGRWRGIQVLPWTRPFHTGMPPDDLARLPRADVWIEAFGCEIAPEFIAAHGHFTLGSGQKESKNPVWINLEYLSAEPYVERCHALPSPVMHGPGQGLTRHFFYPGFTPRTGGLLREPDLPARQAAFDTVYSNANNEEGFIHEAEHIKQLGFDGKSLINPRQIELLHNVFAPTRKEVGNARLIIEASENASRQGLGVVSLNGKMIDAPIIERARWVLQRAEASGIRQ